MPDVHALGTPDADPPRQRVVHVPEQRVPRLDVADGLQERRGARLHPARLHVIQELRDRWGYMRANHIYSPQCGKLGGELRLSDFVGGPVRGDEPGPRETEGDTPDLGPPPV